MLFNDFNHLAGELMSFTEYNKMHKNLK